MKKLLAFVIAALLLAGTAGAAQYVVADVTYPILVNGQPMAFADVPPVNINGRTLLPLRAVAEAVGVPIEWDEANRRVLITQPVSTPETPDIEKLKDSCVMIYTEGNGKWSRGSGVLIDYDEILTCWHVVDEGKTIFKATYDDGAERSLTITDAAESVDAAILKPTATNVKPVKIGDSDEVEVGDTVYVVSSPTDEGKNIVVTSKVAEFSRIFDINVFCISSSITAGGSGGACFNARGELVGIAMALADDGTTCIIPINDIRQALAA